MNTVKRVTATFNQNNGACSSLSGTTVQTIPTANLCSAGTPSTVTGSGPWSWTCLGGVGGSDDSCTANIQTYNVTTSATTGGSISPTSATVNHGAFTSFMVTSADGYRVSSVTGCNGTLSGTNYTTGQVTSACTVSATFIDNSAPAVSISTPTNGASPDFLFEIMGAAMDNTGGSGLNRVELQINVQLGGTTYYINAANQHTSTPTWVTASGTPSWLFNTSLINWQQNKPYTLKARAIDNAGNISSQAVSTFSIGSLNQNVMLLVSKLEAATGTITSNPTGLACDTNCSAMSASFATGTVVTLTATPSTGYYLSGWINCDSSTGNICTVTASANHPTMTAIFNSQKATTLSLTPKTASLTLNNSQTVSGQLATIPVAASSDLNGQTITVTVTKPVGSQTFTTITTDNNGNWSLPLSIFTAKGTYLIKATYAGASKLMSNQSDTATILVEKKAGYAIVIHGKRNDNEGLEDHKYTSDGVVNSLKSRSFLDADITYLTSDNAIAPSRAQLQAAIEVWARDKMNASPGPLYLVMVDHGAPGQFHSGSQEITPADINSWLTNLENSLNSAALAEKRLVIIGTCYSGSFVPDLSKPGRIIITSAADDEESIRGPKIPKETGGFLYSGEYFIDELFTYLGRGDYIKDAFEKAKGTIRDKDVRKQKLGMHHGSYDTLAQHPLMDDDGNGSGTYALAQTGDGMVTASLVMGEGAVVSNSGDNPADIKSVTPTTFLISTQSDAILWLEANNDNRVGSAWIEIKKPGIVPTSGGSGGQVIIDLEMVTLLHNDTLKRWEVPYSVFTTAGTYEIYYYTKDSQTGVVSPAVSSILYRNSDVNTVSSAFNLKSPINGSTTDTSLIMEWESSSDTDGLTYTLEISDTAAFTTMAYKSERLIDTFAVIPDKILTSNKTYYWRVTAIDSLGAQQVSIEAWSFTTDSGLATVHYLNGILYSTTTGDPVNGTVYLSDGNAAKSFVTGPGGGYYFTLSMPGTYTLYALANGYLNSTATFTIASQGRVTHIMQNMGVTPVSGNACGTSNGSTFTSMPGSNLCTTGTPTTVTRGQNGWTWSCTGAGSDATCWAALQGWTVSVSTTGTGSGAVTSNPVAISCTSGSVSGCSSSFTNGASVILTAVPDWKSIFTGWSIGCSGTGTCNLTVTASTSAIATFTRNTKVKLANSLATHASLQDAYSAANDNESFLMQVYAFQENLLFNRTINVKLNGGMDSSYSSTAGVSTIQGSLTIEQGSVEISDVVIQ